MEYNDEQLLSLPQYEVMAKAYAKELRRQGFIFVQIDGEQNDVLIQDLYDCLLRQKTSLFFLGGFMGTNRLYSLNERHIKFMQTLYPELRPVSQYRVRGDKTKCLLNVIGLEGKILSSLLSLTDQSPFSAQLDRVIHERLSMQQTIFSQPNLLQAWQG